MGTVRFEIRKDKSDKDGNSPIRIVYSLQGQRKYIRTDLKANPLNWDEKEQEFIYSDKTALQRKKVKEYNDTIGELRSKIKKAEDKFKANDVIYTPSMIVDAVTPKQHERKDALSNEVYDFIDRYIESHELLRVKGSLSVYKSLKSHLQSYEEKKGIRITFDKIDYVFFEDFQNHLVSLTHTDKKGNKKKLLNNITIAKQLSTLKTFLNYAKQQGIDVSEKYRNFRIKRETDLEVIALNRQEFETLYNLNLSDFPTLEKVRDVFIFSCTTGLRYSDLKQLRRQHIKDDFIELKAIKTDHRTIIPLNPYSKAILQKYKESELPLPVISNQKSNKYLTKVCERAGIKQEIEIIRKYGAYRERKCYPKYELITMHSGRKTFASLSLEAGMSAEYVMKIGGWKDYKSFKRYMNLTSEATKEAMLKAWGGYSNQKLKAV